MQGRKGGKARQYRRKVTGREEPHGTTQTRLADYIARKQCRRALDARAAISSFGHAPRVFMMVNDRAGVKLTFLFCVFALYVSTMNVVQQQ